LLVVEHLVARCPTCDRPVWAKQLARILGFTTRRKGSGELGFVAVTRGKGQGRGWKVKEGLRTVEDVLRVGGVEAVEQLRRLARQALARMWAFGLLTPSDIDEVTSVKRASGSLNPDMPTRTRVPFDDYEPGRRVAATAVPRLASERRHLNTNPPTRTAVRFQP
jgi:hypothetical protein